MRNIENKLKNILRFKLNEQQLSFKRPLDKNIEQALGVFSLQNNFKLTEKKNCTKFMNKSLSRNFMQKTTIRVSLIVNQ